MIDSQSFTFMNASEIRKSKPTLNIKRCLIFFVVTFIVLNLINIKYSLTFFMNSIMVLFFLAFIIGIIFLLFSIEFSGRFKTNIYLAILSFTCFLTICSGFYITEYQAELSKEEGKKIITALNKYKSINNLYPDNLSMLTPEYLESIPNSMMGWFDEPFEYIKRSDKSFDIYFPSYNGDMYKSSSYSNGNWIETD